MGQKPKPTVEFSHMAVGKLLCLTKPAAKTLNQMRKLMNRDTWVYTGWPVGTEEWAKERPMLRELYKAGWIRKIAGQADKYMINPLWLLPPEGRGLTCRAAFKKMWDSHKRTVG